MKITVEDLKRITPGKPLVKALDTRLECNSLRVLVHYVNYAYPIEGYRYTMHATKENIVNVSLVKK